MQLVDVARMSQNSVRSFNAMEISFSCSKPRVLFSGGVARGLAFEGKWKPLADSPTPFFGGYFNLLPLSLLPFALLAFFGWRAFGNAPWRDGIAEQGVKSATHFGQFFGL